MTAQGMPAACNAVSKGRFEAAVHVSFSGYVAMQDRHKYNTVQFSYMNRPPGAFQRGLRPFPA
jgi:hypothetical protein